MRTKGQLTGVVQIEPGSKAPLDARTLVDTLEHLRDYNWWNTDTLYEGLTVTVKEDNSVYVLHSITVENNTFTLDWKRTGVTVDSVLLLDSVNPVENKVVYALFENIKLILIDAGIDPDNPSLPLDECVYHPSDLISDSVTAQHGGLNSTKANLKGLTFSALMDKILFPVTNPTITAPYVDFSLFGIDTKVEANTVILPTATYILEHTSFNKGSMVAGDFKLDRAGEGTYVSGNITGHTVGDVYIRNSITVSCTYNYEEGPTPLNSNGLETHYNASNLIILALPAGTVSGRYSITAYLPIYANNTNNQAFNKILVWKLNNPNEIELDFVSENPEHHSFKIPYNKSYETWYWDTVVNGGSWLKITFDLVLAEVIDVGDKAVDYKLISRHHEPNRLDFVGATKYKIRIS